MYEFIIIIIIIFKIDNKSSFIIQYFLWFWWEFLDNQSQQQDLSVQDADYESSASYACQKS